MFCDSQSSQSNTHTCSWRLIYLPIDQGNFRSSQIIFYNYARLFYFQIQIISFAGSLPNTSKNRNASMSFSNIVNKFHNKNCFTDTCTTKQTNFTSATIRCQKIDNFDPSFK